MGLFSTRNASEILKIPPRKIVVLVEHGVIEPAVPAKGRGTERKFSVANLFQIYVTSHLATLGIAPKCLKHVSGMLTKMKASDVVQGGLKDERSEIGFAELLNDFFEGEKDLPEFLVCAVDFPMMTVGQGTSGQDDYLDFWRFYYSRKGFERSSSAIVLDYRHLLLFVKQAVEGYYTLTQ